MVWCQTPVPVFQEWADELQKMAQYNTKKPAVSGCVDKPLKAADRQQKQENSLVSTPVETGKVNPF